MNPKMLELLKGDESRYPLALEQQFERVLNKILEVWDQPDAEYYFYELLVDDRGGSRQGFPAEVASDIMALQKLYASRHLRLEDEVDVWASVPETKKDELEKLGYAYSLAHFIKAVEVGDEVAVKVFLSCGVDMETRDERGWTPLMISTSNGNEQMSQLLMRCGAKIHVEDRNGYTPLHWSALNGHTDIVEMLLGQGAPVDARSHFGWTAMMQAATRGHVRTVETLLAHGAEVNATSADGWTALHKASANGHIEVVLTLLNKGADSAIAYPDGSTALSLATKNKHDKIVRVLTHLQAATFLH